MPKARVLAVDDQRYFRELVEGLLTEEGFEAQTASSGEEALRVLEHSHFDVVITDLVMPGMDGCELVHRIKQRDADQEVVVVTGVVDVKTAVEAMKLGATDYLLKPFDRTTLSKSLETILQRRRLAAEHSRLLAENIEYLAERSLFERALRLFARLSVPTVAEEIADGLCVETQAQRGVVWTAGAAGAHLELACARGLVRLEEEPRTLQPDELPEAIRRGPARVALQTHGDGADLIVALRSEGRVIGAARLGDKLGGEPFDSEDAGSAERFAGFAEAALANAMRFRQLEERSLRDPATGAYIYPYFEDVARTEIEKASRFGRSLSILAIDPGDLRAARAEHGDARVEAWLSAATGQLQSLLRATDLLALDPDARIWALLSEADALGAARLKERVRAVLASASEGAGPDVGIHTEVAVASYPGDGNGLERLIRSIGERLDEAKGSRERVGELEQLSFGESLHALLDRGGPAPGDAAGQIARFVFDDVGRRPNERRLLFVAPGRALGEALAEGLAALRGVPTRAEIAVLADGERPAYADADVAWFPPRRVHGAPPFLIHYGEGPPFALVRGEGDDPRLFQTGDRSLVEHLALRLRRELAVRAPASGVQ